MQDIFSEANRRSQVLGLLASMRQRRCTRGNCITHPCSKSVAMLTQLGPMQEEMMPFSKQLRLLEAESVTLEQLVSIILRA